MSTFFENKYPTLAMAIGIRQAGKCAPLSRKETSYLASIDLLNLIDVGEITLDRNWLLRKTNH